MSSARKGDAGYTARTQLSCKTKMKKKHLRNAIILIASVFALSGCNKKKEEEPVLPTDQVLTAVTVNDLKAGSYYVKNGSEFYELPVEGVSFDTNKPAKSTNNLPNGMTDPEENRIVDFVYKDQAIPTLYKSDQLVFKSSGNVPSFTWERFLDQGYSIGVYGLQATSAGKIEYSPEKAGNEKMASITRAIQQKIAEGLNIDNGFIIDKVNGTTLTKDNLRTGGIIAGLTKDSVADCDLYIGTNLVSIGTAADMRAFTSFELFTTDLYSNSPDGYAIIDIPEYLKSGYYYLNNAGLVKYYDVERGADTSNIKLDEPYYYKDDNGNVLTYYEYLETTETSDTNKLIEGGVSSLEDTSDVLNFNTDVTQSGINFSIGYKYHTPEDEAKAKQTGDFPKIILVSPTGTATELSVGRTENQDDGWRYASDTIDGAVAGTWQLRFYNFENIYKTVTTDVLSGNAKSFIQTGSAGNIAIHFEASPNANDITITWQNADRAATVTIRTPDGVEYSKEKTPGNVMMDAYGKIVFKLPSMIDGKYNFKIEGSDLGRVWINNEESVSNDNAQISETGIEESESAVPESENIENN